MGDKMHEDIKEQFVKNGFAFPIQIFSTEEAANMRRKFSEYVKLYGSCKQGEVRRIRGNKIFRIHLLAKWARDIVTHPRLVSAVSAVLGSSNLLIWSSDLTVKPAHSTECFGWHQDEAYADLGPPHLLTTAWIALSDTGIENGCVRFLSGSHNKGTLPHWSQPRTENCNLVLGQVVPPDSLPPGDEVHCVLRAGQASLHGWRTVHSSQPNTSSSDRVGLAVRYMSCEVKQARPVVRDRVSLVQGEYTGDWFELEEWPQGEYGKEEWRQHKLSMEREWERRKRSKELGLLPSHKIEKPS